MSTTVPELPEQWKNLDLVSILAQPAAFVSISQCNSLYLEYARQDIKNISENSL